MASCWQALINGSRGHAGSQGSFKETGMEEDQAPRCALKAWLGPTQRDFKASLTHAHTHLHLAQIAEGGVYVCVRA